MVRREHVRAREGTFVALTFYKLLFPAMSLPFGKSPFQNEVYISLLQMKRIKAIPSGKFHFCYFQHDK
jgi:hypothetical protein